jgi:hypothetical protein
VSNKTLQTAAPAAQPSEPIDSETDAFLRAEAIVDAINANLPKTGRPLKPIPKDYVFHKKDREVVSVAMHSAFHLIGGVPALASWADLNKEKFYNLWIKLLPSETQTPVGNFQFNFQTPIPETPSDRIRIGEGGEVIEPAYTELNDDGEVDDGEDIPE